MAGSPPTAQVPSPPSLDPLSSTEADPCPVPATSRHLAPTQQESTAEYTELCLLPVSTRSNAPPAAEICPTPQPNQPPPTPRSLLPSTFATPQNHVRQSDVPDRQQKRHCSDASRQLLTAQSAFGGYTVDFDQLLAVVENHVRQLGNAIRGDVIAYRLLASACSKSDFFFLVLHQAYCLWSLSSRVACWLLDAEPHVVDAAFHQLQWSWRRNSDLSPYHLRWFASFPLLTTRNSDAMRLPKLMASSLMPVINNFLVLMGQNWSVVLGQVVHRGYPLMAWEMNHLLQCPSPVLRSILFICSRQPFGVFEESPSTNALSQLFDLDFCNEASGHVDSPDVVRMRMIIRDRFISLMQQARACSSNHISVANQAQVLAQQHLAIHNPSSATQQILPALPMTSQAVPMSSPASSTPRNAGNQYLPVLRSNANMGVAQGPAQPHLVPFGFSGSPSVAGGGQTGGVFTSSTTPNTTPPQPAPYFPRMQQAQMVPTTQRPMPAVQTRVPQTTATAILASSARGPGSYPQPQHTSSQASQPALTWPSAAVQPPSIESFRWGIMSFLERSGPEPNMACTCHLCAART
ncbi:MIZ zinc finger protein [Ophiocordyceps camponoti-floridani]|uniref:MIZ zinc finger protein n=1 Tax=Ophiocordyceps camponoti-floridani TaxID=2030778 RepID=A0A8H4VGS1_9HYPO|nr:MIZ zinc finger protein [Ophiocordyceps camponoti-floridani]